MRTKIYAYKLTAILALLCVAASVVLGQRPTPTESVGDAQDKSLSQAKPPETPARPAADKSIIYFYRIKQFAGSALEPSIFCDDKELARMDNGRYFGVTLEPGKHTCRMGDKQTGFELDVKAGEEYYAKVTIEAGFWKGHGRLTLLQKEQGAFELKKVKLLGADKVKDRSLVTIFEDSKKN